mgnify:FL=1
MDPKQARGQIFDAVATAAATSVTASQGLSGGTTIYVTDISASNVVGTSTLVLRNQGSATVWSINMAASSLYNYQFKQPVSLTATAQLVIAGASGEKSANFAGYII